MEETLYENLMEAREELKRLEHIIYVSLKYTRTVDVILNALHRMVSTFDLLIESFLKKAQTDGLAEKMAKSPGLRATSLAEIYPNDAELNKYLAFYYFLKKILKAEYTKRQEYRRHVAFITEFDHSTVEVNIDNLVNCERFMHRFFTYSWHTLLGQPEKED